MLDLVSHNKYTELDTLMIKVRFWHTKKLKGPHKSSIIITSTRSFYDSSLEVFPDGSISRNAFTGTGSRPFTKANLSAQVAGR
jgi:hypothetical protein